ncbi:MAG: flavin reductase family protein [Ruminococcus sp.]|nr:flavin reductase family protein [Ruminococcus sp.]
MRKNLGAKPVLYPMPVLIVASYDENGTADAMNAAWGCIADMNRVCIYLAASHKTVKNILSRKAFTVSVADAANVIPADYVGIVSANSVPDKLSKTGWHTMKSEHVDAPMIEELPLTLECSMVSYDEESECMIGEIVNVSADVRIFTEDGKLDMDKLSPIAYDPMNHAYYKLGEKVGNAFQDGAQLK